MEICLASSWLLFKDLGRDDKREKADAGTNPPMEKIVLIYRTVGRLVGRPMLSRLFRRNVIQDGPRCCCSHSTAFRLVRFVRERRPFIPETCKRKEESFHRLGRSIYMAGGTLESWENDRTRKRERERERERERGAFIFDDLTGLRLRSSSPSCAS